MHRCYQKHLERRCQTFPQIRIHHIVKTVSADHNAVFQIVYNLQYLCTGTAYTDHAVSISRQKVTDIFRIFQLWKYNYYVYHYNPPPLVQS